MTKRCVSLFLSGLGFIGAVLAPSMSSAQASASHSALAQCQGELGYAAAFGGRRTFIWRPEWLSAIKSATGRDAIRIRQAIITQARAALGRGPYSVVSKTKTPASGDRHDYHSMAPYWWPDPNKTDGEPYIRRDGQTNPQRNGDGFDAVKLSRLSDDVSALSRAYYLTNDRVYADKAASLVRTWFLDPATRMNPNFAYAQAVPGLSTGRAEGIIDGHRLTSVIEGIGVIGSSGALSQSEMEQLKTWFGALATWMISSEIGQEERAKNNNHGIYYDFLLSHYALFAGKTEIARDVIQAFPQRRIAVQFAPDGTLPEELSRTRSWHYVNWTLAATSKLAGLGQCVNVDLWHATSPDGASLSKSLSWLARYVAREATWPYPESAFKAGGNPKQAYGIAFENFRLAAWGLNDPGFEALAGYYGRLDPLAEAHGWLAPRPTNPTR